MASQVPKTASPLAERDLTARDLMTPGVVAVPVTTRLAQAAAALTAHGVHAVLVVSCYGKPAGWLTAHGLLAQVNTDRSLAWAVDAIGEPMTAVDPQATSAEVVSLLSEPGVSRLAVQENPEWMPEGVIADIDLVAILGDQT